MTIIYILLIFLFADIAFALVQGIRGKGNSDSAGMLHAKFTPGAIISEIRNKIASTVFSRNRAGAIIRNRINPINRRSALQTQIRQQLASLASSWRGLTQLQRDGWNALSSEFPQQDNLGQTIFLTGEQLYVRSNQNLLLIDEAIISNPPAVTSFPVITPLSGVVSAAAVNIAFTIDPVPAGFAMIVRATGAKSAGRNFAPQSDFRFIDFADPAEASPFVVTVNWHALFGATPAVGNKTFFEIFYVEISSGLSGQKARVSVIGT